MRFVVVGAGAVGGVVGGRLFEHGHEVVLVAQGEHGRAIASSGPDAGVGHGRGGPACPREGLGPQRRLAGRRRGPTGSEEPGHRRGPAPTECVRPEVGRRRLRAERGGQRAWRPAPVRPCLRHLCHVPRQPPRARRRGGQFLARNRSARHRPLPIGFRRRRRPGGGGTVRQAPWSRSSGPTSCDGSTPSCSGTWATPSTPYAAPATGTPAWRNWRGRKGRACLKAAGIEYVTVEEDRARRGDRLHPGDDVSGYPRGGSSSWQSLARGQRTIETDYLNGEVVLLGRLHGVPTPVNGLLQDTANRMAHDRVAPGSISADELLALLDDPKS